MRVIFNEELKAVADDLDHMVKGVRKAEFSGDFHASRATFLRPNPIGRSLRSAR